MMGDDPKNREEDGGDGDAPGQTFVQIEEAPRQLDVAELDWVLQEVYLFWVNASDNGPPSKAAIDPVALKRVLPHLILWEVLGDTYRCRLAGTDVCYYAGRELRGETLEQVYGAGSEAVKIEFDAVRDRSVAHFVVRTMDWVQRPHRYYRRLLLPLVGSSGKVDVLLGAINFEPPGDKPRRPSPILSDY